MGIITQMVLDFQPLSLVNNKGFLIDKRLTLPSLQVHTPWWYQDKIEKVNHHLMNFNLICKLPTLYIRVSQKNTFFVYNFGGPITGAYR